MQTQFHAFAGQSLGWGRDGDVARIMDVHTQPVASDEIARLLLELATAETARDTDLAGPQQERLVDQVRRLVQKRGEDVRVEAADAPASMAGGSMLPGPPPSSAARAGRSGSPRRPEEGPGAGAGGSSAGGPGLSG